MGNSLLFPAPVPKFNKDSFPMLWADNIPCLYLPHDISRPSSNLFIIWFHGNGCDIGSMRQMLLMYSKHINISILCFEYPGYGICKGLPSEASINQNAQKVYDFVVNTLKIPSEQVLLYGHSIGSGAACFLAGDLISKKKPFAGLILQSSYESIRDVTYNIVGYLLSYAVSDMWINRNEIVKLKSEPVLVIHGSLDTLIPVKQATNLYKICPSSKKQLSLFEFADHNSFDQSELIEVLIKFIDTHYPLTKSKPLPEIDKKYYQQTITELPLPSLDNSSSWVGSLVASSIASTTSSIEWTANL
jgi:predicted esterase